MHTQCPTLSAAFTSRKALLGETPRAPIRSGNCKRFHTCRRLLVRLNLVRRRRRGKVAAATGTAEQRRVAVELFVLKARELRLLKLRHRPVCLRRRWRIAVVSTLPLSTRFLMFGRGGGVLNGGALTEATIEGASGDNMGSMKERRGEEESDAVRSATPTRRALSYSRSADSTDSALLLAPNALFATATHARTMMDRVRQQRQKLLDPESQQREPSFRDDMNTICPSLTYQERVIGCVTCFTLGFLLSLGSTFRLAKLVHGNPGPFATAYTIGNLLSLGSSTFFVGPYKQVQTMFHKKRRGSAMVYILFIGVTLALCFSPNVPHRVGLVLICVIVQFMALVWYTLSYIPYGRNIALSCCKRMCGVADDDM